MKETRKLARQVLSEGPNEEASELLHRTEPDRAAFILAAMCLVFFVLVAWHYLG